MSEPPNKTRRTNDNESFTEEQLAYIDLVQKQSSCGRERAIELLRKHNWNSTEATIMAIRTYDEIELLKEYMKKYPDYTINKLLSMLYYRE